MALIGVAVPGRPIGPWSRRTGAPEASATGWDRATLLRARLGPRLVHTPSEPSSSQRSPVVSSARSFAQVAGAILQKQTPVQNPDKDEFSCVLY